MLHFHNRCRSVARDLEKTFFLCVITVLEMYLLSKIKFSSVLILLLYCHYDPLIMIKAVDSM